MHDTIGHKILNLKRVIQSKIKFEDFGLNYTMAHMIYSVYKQNTIIWIITGLEIM